jgi:hypothetical protein
LSRKKIHPTDLCWTEGIAERKPVSAVFRSKAVPPPILGAPPLSKKPPDSSTPAAHIENVKRMQNDALAADPNKLAAERCYLERLRLIRPASGFGAFQSNGWPKVGSGSKAGQGTTSADRIPDDSIQFPRGPPFIAREVLREAGRMRTSTSQARVFGVVRARL